MAWLCAMPSPRQHAARRAGARLILDPVARAVFSDPNAGPAPGASASSISNPQDWLSIGQTANLDPLSRTVKGCLRRAASSRCLRALLWSTLAVGLGVKRGTREEFVGRPGCW